MARKNRQQYDRHRAKQQDGKRQHADKYAAKAPNRVGQDKEHDDE